MGKRSMKINPAIRKCLQQINDPWVRKFTREVLLRSPLYFWSITASASGRYHPIDERGKYGLVRHTVRVSNIAEIILESLGSKVEHPDHIRAGALLHDIMRYGIDDSAEENTNEKHPELAHQFILDVADDLGYANFGEYYQCEQIAKIVLTHSGKWGAVKCQSIEEWVVHISDAIAAKYWNGNGVKFEM